MNLETERAETSSDGPEKQTPAGAETSSDGPEKQTAAGQRSGDGRDSKRRGHGYQAMALGAGPSPGLGHCLVEH